MDAIFERASEAAGRLADVFDGRVPRAAIVLGSGLGAFASYASRARRVSYEEIPHFWRPTVEGHAGAMILGVVSGLDVAILSGRNHLYEGVSASRVGLPIRALALAGVETLVLTNAAGGVNPEFAAGDLMAIEDHINFTGENPLRGPHDSRLGARFPDMTEVYDAGLRAALARVADRLGIGLRRGVYLCLTGPSYETPAEVRMVRALGADAVGMSTVPEAIVARHCHMRVAAVSCITNAAAGLSGSPLVHSEVIETAASVAERFQALLAGLCEELASGDRTEHAR